VAERVLTLRELNRATLARQLLLERKRLPLVRAVERVAGLQAQWGPAPYVGLWTRVEGFKRDALERALLQTKIVRAVLMRGTIHLVSLPDYALFGAAVGNPPWLRPDAADLGDTLHDAIRAFGSEPRTRAEVMEFLAREHGLAPAHAEPLWYALRIRGRLTHAPETGLWKTSGRTRYVTIAHEAADPTTARAALVRRYLAAFGPATRADISEWSGLRVRDFEDLLEGLPTYLDEHGRTLYDVARAPLAPGDAPAPVRLMPRFDNLVLSHKDRTRVLADEHRGAVIEGGWVKSTFLVDGFVAGTWEVEGGRVAVEPFAPLPRSVRAELEAEAAQLQAWLS
jgi:DNA glycosylase AlkZ-like